MLSEFEISNIALFHQNCCNAVNYEHDMFDHNKWNSFIDKATKNGISSQIYMWLRRNKQAEGLTMSNQKHLQSLSILASTRNQQLLSEYQTITQELQKNSIPFSPLKGIWLLENLYPSNYPRLTSDMDILVHPEDIQKVSELSREMGYKQDPLRSRFDSKISSPPGHHIPALRKNSISIEWHFKPYSTASSEICRELLETPGPEVHFYVMAKHLQRHYQAGFGQLKWLFDLILLSSQLPLDKFLNWMTRVPEIENPIQIREFAMILFPLSHQTDIRNSIALIDTALDRFLNNYNNNNNHHNNHNTRVIPRIIPAQLRLNEKY